MNRGKNSNLLPGQKLAHECADLTISGVPRRRQPSAKAAHLFGEAEIARGQAEYAKRHFGPASSEPAYQEYVAEASEKKAAELLIPEGEVVHYDKANEVLLFAPDDDRWDSKRSMLVDTLINADMIAVDASEMRLEAVQGAKTREGRERIRKANLRHGGYTPEAKTAKKQARVELERARQILRDLRRFDEQEGGLKR